MSRALLLLLIARTSAAACTSDLDCALNGVCNTADGTCTCDVPWTGPRCESLTFAQADKQPTAGKDLYPASDTFFNTWNGPMLGPINGSYHMYMVLYPVKGKPLYDPTYIAHGTAPSRLGPWVWKNLTSVDVNRSFGFNPGALTSVDPATGKPIYSLWVSGALWRADDPAGPFKNVTALPDACHVNPSPLFVDGVYYCAGSHGGTIMKAPALEGPWTEHTETMAHLGEDGFLYVDARSNWHALFHASNGSQLTHCSTSRVASHAFSADGGKTWNWTTPSGLLGGPISSEPYKPVVHWADGTQVYSTMERPHAYLDATGRMTHLGVAAPLNVGDEGCKEVPNCFPGRDQGHCPCVNCKYTSHAGSLLITLWDGKA